MDAPQCFEGIGRLSRLPETGRQFRNRNVVLMDLRKNTERVKSFSKIQIIAITVAFYTFAISTWMQPRTQNLAGLLGVVQLYGWMLGELDYPKYVVLTLGTGFLADRFPTPSNPVTNTIVTIAFVVIGLMAVQKTYIMHFKNFKTAAPLLQNPNYSDRMLEVILQPHKKPIFLQQADIDAFITL